MVFVRYSVLLICMGFGLPNLAAWLAGGASGVPWWTFASMFVLGLLSWVEWRRDDYAYAQLCAAVGAVMIIGCGSFWAFEPRFMSTHGLLFVGVAPFWVWAVVHVVRCHRMSDSVPNALVARFGRDAIVEISGVMLAVEPTRPYAEIGRPFSVTLWSQNGWDAPRRLQVSAVRASDIFRGPAVRFRAEQEIIQLSALAEAVLRFEIVPTEVGPLRFYVDLTVFGGGGTRKLARVRPYVPRIRGGLGWIQALSDATVPLAELIRVANKKPAFEGGLLFEAQVTDPPTD